MDTVPMFDSGQAMRGGKFNDSLGEALFLGPALTVGADDSQHGEDHVVDHYHRIQAVPGGFSVEDVRDAFGSNRCTARSIAGDYLALAGRPCSRQVLVRLMKALKVSSGPHT